VVLLEVQVAQRFLEFLVVQVAQRFLEFLVYPVVQFWCYP
jgi:hypothetical protein